MARIFTFDCKNLDELSQASGGAEPAFKSRVLTAATEVRSVVQFPIGGFASWTDIMPAFTAPLTARIGYAMAIADVGAAHFQMEVEAITIGSSTDMRAAPVFDTPNVFAVSTVPSAIGRTKAVTLQLANLDALAQFNFARFRLTYRDTSTAVGSALVFAWAIDDAS